MLKRLLNAEVREVRKDSPTIPVFQPDFEFDNKLYQQIDGLNEVSIALTNHELANSVRMRLTEFSPPVSVCDGLSDSQILDNMVSSEMSTSSLLQYAHDLEEQILHPKED